MKESKLIEMKNKVESLTRVVQQLINELQFTRELAVGTLETIKLMPDYQEALDKLKKEVTTKDESKEKTEVQTD